MENTNIKSKQAELKNLIKKIGISQAKFARRVFCNISDSDDEKEMNLFCEKFKKHLNRNASIEVLETYLEFLYEQNEFIKLDLIKPKFYYDESFDADFIKKMKQISKSISKNLEDIKYI